MVCAVCSVDRSDEDGELVVLDYPRYSDIEKPCPNCGAGEVLRDAVRQEFTKMD